MFFREFRLSLLKFKCNYIFKYWSNNIYVQVIGDATAPGYIFMLNGQKYIGFTNDEVLELCQKYGIDFEQMKSWYDGYIFGYSKYTTNSTSGTNIYDANGKL